MIELRNINKGFDDRIVLENLNYNFYEGNSYALIGASGAGKTTLLNIIGKLEEADSGDIIVNDINLNNIKEKDVTDPQSNMFLLAIYNIIRRKRHR